MAQLDIPVINGQQFATRFALRPNQYAWFLGAGASASAGIPTGYAMIRDFKTQLYCQETKIPRREVDAADPLWIARIDDYFKKHAILPSAGDPLEYARAFQAVYPRVEDRRIYINKQVLLGRPSFAHRVLAGLLITSRTPCVFTTNFDDLVETAATVIRQLPSGFDVTNLTVAAIDSAERARRCLRENDWPLIAKIHGDFQSVELKNTEDELAVQDERMRSVLIESCSRFALVVVGYSGRDDSVMAALRDVLKESNPYPGGIYWVTRSPPELLPAVREFLESALAKGVSAHIVQSENFDEFAGDLADTIEFGDVLEQHIRAGQSPPVARLVALPSHEALTTPILRFSALRVMSLPKVARRLQLTKPANVREVRECLKQAKVKACIASVGNEYAVFGSDSQLMSALKEFGPRLAGTIELDPISNSWAVGLIYDALTKALCKGRPLNPRLSRRGHSVLVSAGHPQEDEERRSRRMKDLAGLQLAYVDSLVGKVSSLGFPFNESVRIRLEQSVGHWWCVFDPCTSVELPREEYVAGKTETLPEDATTTFQWKPNPAADWTRERWARRYNQKWASIIDSWSKMLGGDVRAFWIDEADGIDAAFSIGSVTAWSRPSHHHAYFQRGSR